MLGVMLHAPRGLYYSTKVATSRLSPNWKALVAFCPWVHRTVRCTTGQWTVRDFLPCLVKPTIAATILVAHRTVRWCTKQSDVAWWPLAKSACRPLIAWPIVGWTLCWHTRQSSGASDSPVGHQTVRWILAVVPSAFPESGQFTVAPAWAPDTVRCTAG
jgi:hypothetical protein